MRLSRLPKRQFSLHSPDETAILIVLAVIACRARGTQFTVAQDARRDDPGTETVGILANVG
jgi:hypothetical protein